jgi:hypothetical protein
MQDAQIRPPGASTMEQDIHTHAVRIRRGERMVQEMGIARIAAAAI